MFPGFCAPHAHLPAPRLTTLHLLTTRLLTLCLLQEEYERLKAEVGIKCASMEAQRKAVTALLDVSTCMWAMRACMHACMETALLCVSMWCGHACVHECTTVIVLLELSVKRARWRYAYSCCAMSHLLPYCGHTCMHACMHECLSIITR